jgi:hypothetical protein
MDEALTAKSIPARPGIDPMLGKMWFCGAHGCSGRLAEVVNTSDIMLSPDFDLRPDGIFAKSKRPQQRHTAYKSHLESIKRGLACHEPRMHRSDQSREQVEYCNKLLREIKQGDRLFVKTVSERTRNFEFYCSLDPTEFYNYLPAFILCPACGRLNKITRASF